MIPRIQTGNSFVGAGLYYLHDKKREGERERLTDERVAWTYALNTLEDEPEAVLAEMRQTALDQSLLKQLAGKRLDGRPTERTVMTVALAWSPEQERPTKEHMIETGRSYLQSMGWQEHQVLFVGHNDTKHPHFHMIINRVHPETGMTLDDNWSKTRAQKWALGYEREHGRIFCEAREAKYSRDQARDAPHMNYREWKAWQEIAKENAFDPEFRQALEAGEWTVLQQTQKRERKGFWAETGKMRKDLRVELREQVRGEFAEEWQAYTLDKAERLEKARTYDQEARRAMRHYRRHGKLHGVDAVAKIKERQTAYHARQREELAAIRADITARQIERLEELAGPALEALGKERAAAYQPVLARHRRERKGLTKDQKRGIRRQDVLSGFEGGEEPQHAPSSRHGKQTRGAQDKQASKGRADRAPRKQSEPATEDRHRPQTMREKMEASYRRHERENSRQPELPRQSERATRAQTQERTGRDADRRADTPARDPLGVRQARTEMTERKAATAGRQQEMTERKVKDIEHARRIAAVDEMLAERKFDRERGGGRTRDR
jgi:hypothetical protein